MPGLLCNALWSDYRDLEGVLAGNGYSPKKRINGFALYQLGNPNQLGERPGTFLALRESELEPNRVETAIFWTGSSLEDAIEALGSLPAKTVGETLRNSRVFSYGSVGILMTGFVVGALTNSTGIGVGAATLYLAGKAAYSLLLNYGRWQSALSVFGNHVEGKPALSMAIEFAEISV